MTGETEAAQGEAAAASIIAFWPGQEGAAAALVAGRPAALARAYDADGLRRHLGEGGTGAVIWSGLGAALAAALASGGAPGAAVAAWRARAEGLLALFRRHRRRLVLVEAGTLSAANGALLARRLGTAAEAAVPAPPDAGGATCAALAALAIATDAGLHRLAAELEASSLAHDRPGPAVLIAAALAAAGRRDAEAAALALRLEAAGRAAAEADESVRLMGATLAGLARLAQGLDETATDPAPPAADPAATLAARLAAAGEELELLRAQVALDRRAPGEDAPAPPPAPAVAAGDAGDEAAKVALARALAAARAEAEARADIEGELVRLRRALEERQAQTAEVARLRADLRAATAEAAAGIARIGQIAADRDAVKAGRAEADATLAALRGEHDRLAADHAGLALRLGEAEGRAALLDDERRRLLESTSWRLTAPLRSISRTVRRLP
ncbi:MAG: hypothetical protein IT545_09305 [Rhodobacteraceae bacterium]|nr:hypothetical protein [Paracoccaceae bacterium]